MSSSMKQGMFASVARLARRGCWWGLIVLPLAVSLSSCGGGAGSADPTPPVVVPPADAGPAIVLPREAVAAAHVSLVSALGEGSAETRFDWDLGDGTRSSEPNPAHAYLKPGRYDITLTVTQGNAAPRTSRASLQVAPLRSTTTSCEGQGGGTFCSTALVDRDASRVRVFVQSSIAGSALASGDLVRFATDGAGQREATPAGWMAGRFEPWFVDPQVGVAIWGTGIVRTADGGATWRPVAVPIDPVKEFIERLTLAADGSILGSVNRYLPVGPSLRWEPTRGLVSRDRGLTWVRLDQPVLPPVVQGPQPKAPERPEGGANWFPRGTGRHLWAQWFDAGSPDGNPGPKPISLHYSDDYGQTWRRADLPAVVAPAEAYLELLTDSDHPVAMLSTPQQRWLTVDGGRRWREVKLAVEAGNITQVQRVADGSLVVRSWYGQDYVSRDDGLSWWQATGQAPFLLPEGAQPWLFGDGRGIYVPRDRPEWYETADGGVHWLRRGAVALRPEVFGIGFDVSLQFSSPSVGWWAISGRLYRSGDAGRSWQLQSLPVAVTDRVKALKFVSERDGFLLARVCQDLFGSEPCTVQLHGTRDGGSTWQRRETPFDGESNVDMGWASERRGVALPRSGGLWTTADGGQSWRRADYFPEYGGKVLFTDANLGWLIGSFGFYRTADGGATWTSFPLPPWPGQVSSLTLRDVAFDPTGMRGFIVGYLERYGDTSGNYPQTRIVYRSTDGGVTWLPQ